MPGCQWLYTFDVEFFLFTYHQNILPYGHLNQRAGRFHKIKEVLWEEVSI